MAQPDRNQTPLYRKRNSTALYRITYTAQSGAKRPGIPHDDATTLINLARVYGPASEPQFIVTSEYDFALNFEAHNPKQADRPESGPAVNNPE